jgi:shikimate kinase
MSVSAGARASRLGHLVLVGLPGAGKTTVGPLVAAALARPFLDFDAELVRRAGRPVSEIFATAGEAAFRLLESELTEELASVPPMVLAPGGGWITNPGAVARLRPPGRLVHLSLTPGAALARLGGDRGTRPLLAGPDPAAAMERLWSQRRDAYATADWVLNVENLEVQQVVQSVLSLARSGRPAIG